MSLIKSGYIWKGTKDEFSGPKSMSLRLNKMFSDGDLIIGTNSDGYTPDDGITPNAPTNLSFTSGVESIVLNWLWEQNTLPLKTWIYESTTSTITETPSFFVGQNQKTFFRDNLVAGSVRYYWVKVEGRNGRFSLIAGPLSATVATWPVTNTITTNLSKKITRSDIAPETPNDGDIWINTTENNILYRYDTNSWVAYPDKRVDSIADEYVLMVTPTGAGPSQRIMGFRATNADSGKLISSASRSSNTITIVTATAHGYTSLDLISMTGIGYSTINPNGSYAVTVTGAATFTYTTPTGSSTESYAVSGAYAAKGTEFVIQADKFSIINSDGAAQIAPFQVVSGTTYIKNALIQEVSAGKITAGTITSQSLTISDGSTVNSGIIQSSGFVSGSSGWRIRGTGDAEFNTITVRNGIITAPAISGNAAFADGLIINTTLGIRRSVDTAVLTITGASGNGSSHGAQIDLVGNEYNKAASGDPDYSDAGVLVLQAGSGVGSAVRLLTNQSPTTNVGVVRLSVKTDGLVTVEKNLSFGDAYTANAGSLRVEKDLNVVGAITVGTPLAVGQGGTGANTAANARIALLPAYASNIGKVLTVNSEANNVEWSSAGAGTVTSVAGTGTINGLTLTGTVTGTGSLTLGGTLTNVSLTTSVTGTLPIANGGTSASTASGARDALLPNYSGHPLQTLRVNSATNDVEWSTAGSGTVTSVSVAAENGFTGSIASSTSTPVITLTAGDLSVSSIVVGGNTVIEGRKAAVTAAVTNYPAVYASDFTGDDTINLTDLASHLTAVDAALNLAGQRINDLIARLNATNGHGLIAD